MSGKVVGWAFDQRLGSSTTKLVLVKLADNANDQGLCWPGVASLAADTELSDRAVRKEIKWLEDQGFLTIRRRVQQRGQVSNVYQLNIPWGRGGKGAPPPEQDSGGTLNLDQAPPERGAGHTLNQIQGHKENRQTEPPLNLAPPSAQPLTGRAGRLATMFEQKIFDAWFKGAYFREGPPLTIVLSTRARCNYVRDQFGDRLRTAFDDDHMVFAFHRDREATADE